MVFFHAFYDMSLLFPLGKTLLDFFTPFEPFFAGMFILVSGVACNLSHNNLKRGGLLLLIAVGVTLVTLLVLPSEAIYFGILHLLSVSMLLYAVLRPVIQKIPIAAGVVVTLLLFLLTYGVSDGHIGVLDWVKIPLPSDWYQTKVLFPLGLRHRQFFSADYFPLLPWLFLFFCGSFLGRLGVEKGFPAFFHPRRSRFFSFLGRHSLVIYLLHQPILYGLLWLIQFVVTS